MNDNLLNLITLDRDNISQGQRDLLLRDLSEVIDEHLERTSRIVLDITKTEKGFSVCILLEASRIRESKKPN